MIPEQSVSLAVGRDLSLEALLALPASPTAGVVICHPHPLYGGDMENPVVVRVQEVCSSLGLATLRFNFRGVGASGGAHGGGVGEQEDALAALDTLAKAIGSAALAIAGYSFGSRIAALVGSRDSRMAGMALIAPPLAMSDFGFLEDRKIPTLAVAGTRDQYCPPDEFARFTAARPWIKTAAIEGADHFFFGKLFPLGEAVTEWAQQLSTGRGAR
jgi:alpha/beta superfamily hydrolase